jgi:hypothetical protein
MDLRGYDLYFQGALEDYALPSDEIDKALNLIKDLPKPAVNRTGRWEPVHANSKG